MDSVDDKEMTIYEYKLKIQTDDIRNKLKLLESSISGEFSVIKTELSHIKNSLNNRKTVMTRLNLGITMCLISSFIAVAVEVVEKLLK